MRKEWKRLIALLLLLPVLLLAPVLSTGCSRGDDGIRVGMLLTDFTNHSQTLVMEGAQRAVAAMAARGEEVEVLYYNAEQDQNKQLEQAENLVVQGVDVVCVMVVDQEASRPMVDMLHAEGIPLVALGVPFADPSRADCYVGGMETEAGALAMEAAADALGGAGGVVVLDGRYGQDRQRRIREGMDRVLEANPGLELLGDGSGDWSREDALRMMENWLQSDIGGRIDAVVAANDQMAIGALGAIKELGLEGRILVGGIGGTPEARELLEQGTLAFTVDQDGAKLGEKAVEAAVRLASGEQVEPEVRIPYRLLDSSDAAD
ncbi:substrate-binding domain-containing protein [Anaerotalea alkaliphila]|uniref:Substrate-binding domain-containing protein n=1 Tax=Anaerotalea alkaliphila TaxID=2662126 RepID=A0A7X5HVN2_9FIRM|nr:substrate-binding domain-containing protein [Anaerotalea alkaliphila]NDL67508.1 substrate-binding domain-containing protein [Anaerotalea alkaliphila]